MTEYIKIKGIIYISFFGTKVYKFPYIWDMTSLFISNSRWTFNSFKSCGRFIQL